VGSGELSFLVCCWVGSEPVEGDLPLLTTENDGGGFNIFKLAGGLSCGMDCAFMLGDVGRGKPYVSADIVLSELLVLRTL